MEDLQWISSDAMLAGVKKCERLMKADYPLNRPFACSVSPNDYKPAGMGDLPFLQVVMEHVHSYLNGTIIGNRGHLYASFYKLPGYLTTNVFYRGFKQKLL